MSFGSVPFDQMPAARFSPISMYICWPSMLMMFAMASGESVLMSVRPSMAKLT